jgi:TPR repeat protein
MTRNSFRSLVNAAKRGNVDAQYQLAAMLATGDRIEKDVAAAAHWYAKAAARNHPEALYNLGLMHILGEIGRPAVKKGMALIKRAAKLDSWDAHWYLAHVFMDGGHGQPRDLDKAAYYSVLAMSPQFGNAADALAHRLQQRDGITAPILARALLKFVAESRRRRRKHHAA